MAKQGSWKKKWREKEYDVTALGELLVDFTESGVSNQGNYLFEANPGGAPCNVLAMLAKLGKKTAFIGKVGNDFLGKHLKEVVREAAPTAGKGVLRRRHTCRKKRLIQRGQGILFAPVC